MKEIIVSSNDSGQRLDKLIARYLNKAPKSFIYKMLRKKNIKLNKGKASGNEMLQEGDIINIFLSDDTIDNFREAVRTEGYKSNYKLDIIYEDENVLIVNKPVGMLSQKAGITDISINEHIITYYQSDNYSYKVDNSIEFKPSVCNRLDRNTSGIILAGMSLKGSQVLSELLRERTLNKYYLTIVKGEVKKKAIIDGYLSKDSISNKVAYSDSSIEGFYPIKTEYEPIKYNGEYTYLKVKLITGKPHQIRAHLASIGHPIIGDSKYGDSKINKTFKEKYRLKYQLLHAYLVEFPTLDNDLRNLSNKSFEANLPKQFLDIRKDLFYRRY